MLNFEISTNLLIIISSILFLLVVSGIIFIIYKDRKNDREEIDDIIDDLVKAKPRDDKNPLIMQEIEVKIGAAKEPLKKDLNSKSNLEDMIYKMQENLESKDTDVVANFEHEQEEKAIISYQELVDNLNKDNFKQEIVMHEEQEELVTTASLLRQKDPIAKEMIREILEKKDVSNKIKKIESPRENKDKKFKTTDFISPIYGKMDSKIEYPKIKAMPKIMTDVEEYFQDDYKHARYDEINESKKVNTNFLEEVVNIEPIGKEIKKNIDFLKALKEFRNNL